MRFKRIILALLSTLVLSSCSAFIGNHYTDEHKHVFSDAYACDEENHWHYSICEHDVESDKEPHQYTSWKTLVSPSIRYEGEQYRRCRECGYKQTKKLEKTSVFFFEDIFYLASNKTEVVITGVLCGVGEYKVGDKVYAYLSHDMIKEYTIGGFTYNKDSSFESFSVNDSMSKEERTLAFRIAFEDEETASEEYVLINTSHNGKFLAKEDNLLPEFDENDTSYSSSEGNYKPIRAIFDFLTTDSGGVRNSPISLPYTPQAHSNDAAFDFTCAIEGGEVLKPGTQNEVLFRPHYSSSTYLYDRMTFNLYEKGHLIAIVTLLFN